MMRDKKILYIVIALVVCAIIGLIIILIPKGKKYEKTVFIGSNTRITVNGDKLSMFYDDEKIKKQSVKVFSDNEIVDGYIKTEKEQSTGLDNYMNVYDNNDNLIMCEPILIAYTNDLSLTIVGVNTNVTEKISDMVNPLLKSGIDITTVNPDYFIISSFDYDEDEKAEYIYSMGLLQKGNKYESIVVMEKDGKYYPIARESSDYSNEEKVSLSFVGLIDFNGDKDFEYIINRNEGESTPGKIELYNFNNTEFIKVNMN